MTMIPTRLTTSSEVKNNAKGRHILPAGSFFPDLSRTPMICSFRSTDETRDNSLGLGRRRGTSVTTDGKGSNAPTIDVASVLGTPEMRQKINENQGKKGNSIFTKALWGHSNNI